MIKRQMDTAEIKISLKIWEYVTFEYKNAEIQIYKSFRDTCSFFINIINDRFVEKLYYVICRLENIIVGVENKIWLLRMRKYEGS